MELLKSRVDVLVRNVTFLSRNSHFRDKNLLGPYKGNIYCIMYMRSIVHVETTRSNTITYLSLFVVIKLSCFMRIMLIRSSAKVGATGKVQNYNCTSMYIQDIDVRNCHGEKWVCHGSGLQNMVFLK